VRGKAGKPTEFGAKIAATCIDSYILLSHLSWDNFNEALWLETQIENYKDLTGFYPESVHVDKIYRNRNNRKYCKDRGIRMSGPPLGRPPKNITKSMKQQSQRDERIRNEIEGKFGQGKRRFGLNQIMSKLSETAETEIAIAFLVMNLTTLLKRGYYLLLGAPNILGRPQNSAHPLFYIFAQHQRFFANLDYQYLYKKYNLINKNYLYGWFINLSKLFVFSFTYSASPN
jgi:hypothetical protein